MPKKSLKSKKATLLIPPQSIIFILLALLVFIAALQTVAQNLNNNFDMPYGTQVLGDSEDAQESAEKQQEQNKEMEQKQIESEQKNQEQAQEQAKQQAEMVREQSKEVEIQSSDGTKIKVKKEDNGQVKAEVEQGTLHFKYESSASGVTKKVETEDGDEVMISSRQLKEVEKDVESELEKEGLQVSTEDGRLKFTKSGISFTSEYPLSVGNVSRLLAVQTPEGEKEVKKLPDEILSTLQSQGEIATLSGTPGENISLKVKNGQPVYEINGQKVYRLLNLFDVAQTLKLTVSAETGEVVSTDKSFFTNLISLLSF